MKQVSFIFWRRLFINSGSDCIVNHPLLTNFVFPIQSKTDYTHNLIFSNYFSFSIFFFTSPTFHFISMEFEPTITSLLQYLLTVINSERTTRIDLQTRFSILQEDFHYLERRHVELEEWYWGRRNHLLLERKYMKNNWRRWVHQRLYRKSKLVSNGWFTNEMLLINNLRQNINAFHGEQSCGLHKIWIRLGTMSFIYIQCSRRGDVGFQRFPEQFTSESDNEWVSHSNIHYSNYRNFYHSRLCRIDRNVEDPTFIR